MALSLKHCSFKKVLSEQFSKLMEHNVIPSKKKLGIASSRLILRIDGHLRTLIDDNVLGSMSDHELGSHRSREIRTKSYQSIISN